MSDLYSSEYNQHGHPTRGVLISWPIRHELSPEEICDSLGYTQEQIASLRRQAQTGQTQRIQPARVRPGDYENSNYEANEPYILSYLEDPTPITTTIRWV
jgi:hypothetical protein